MKNVIAGIVCYKNKVLIAKRDLNQSMGGKWEFPGGKMEVGESPEECLRRELQEELNIQVDIREYFGENINHFEEKCIKLRVFICDYLSGDIELTVHSNFKWVDLFELENYDFTPADIPFVKKLIKRGI